MACYFVDSSGLVKRYVREKGSAWLLSIADPRAGNELFLARITAVEVVSALVRYVTPLDPKTLQRTLADFKTDLQTHYQLVEITSSLMDKAMEFAEKHRLRGYDAVQLAAATALHAVQASLGVSPPTFVSSDQLLNAAATAEGLSVEDPSTHP